MGLDIMLTHLRPFLNVIKFLSLYKLILHFFCLYFVILIRHSNDVHGLISELLIRPEEPTCLSQDFFKLIWIIPYKESMIEFHYAFFFDGNFLEVVHVELTMKRFELLVLKISLEQILFKCLFIKNSEAWILSCPANDCVG